MDASDWEEVKEKTGTAAMMVMDVLSEEDVQRAVEHFAEALIEAVQALRDQDVPPDTIASWLTGIVVAEATT